MKRKPKLKYRMRPAALVLPLADVAIDEQKYPAFELDPSKRYIVHVEIGDLPPKQAHVHLKQVYMTLKQIFSGPGKFVVLPCRNGVLACQIYELEPVEA